MFKPNSPEDCSPEKQMDNFEKQNTSKDSSSEKDLNVCKKQHSSQNKISEKVAHNLKEQNASIGNSPKIDPLQNLSPQKAEQYVSEQSLSRECSALKSFDFGSEQNFPAESLPSKTTDIF